MKAGKHQQCLKLILLYNSPFDLAGSLRFQWLLWFRPACRGPLNPTKKTTTTTYSAAEANCHKTWRRELHLNEPLKLFLLFALLHVKRQEFFNQLKVRQFAEVDWQLPPNCLRHSRIINSRNGYKLANNKNLLGPLFLFFRPLGKLKNGPWRDKKNNKLGSKTLYRYYVWDWTQYRWTFFRLLKWIMNL